MQEYDVKRGLIKNTDLRGLFDAHFGSSQMEDDWIVGSCGNMSRIAVKYGKTTLIVDTTNDPSFAKRVAAGDQEALATFQDTHKRWNTFLLDATGYDSKTRSKKIQEKAKKEAKAA